MFDAGQQLLLVGGARSGQHHGVHVRVGDRVQGIGDGPAPGTVGGDRLGLLGEVVVDHRHAGAGDPVGQPGYVIGAHDADAENGYAQVGHVYWAPR